MTERKARGAAWNEERGTSDQGRRARECAWSERGAERE